MSDHRRTYKLEYKREAVRLADNLGNTSQAARDLCIRANLIHRWRRQLLEDRRRTFPGNETPRDEEFARLRRELTRAKEELAIPVIAVGIVSSPSR